MAQERPLSGGGTPERRGLATAVQEPGPGRVTEPVPRTVAASLSHTPACHWQ